MLPPSDMGRSILALIGVAVGITAVAAQTGDQVTFPSGGLTLHGTLFKPAGDGPFPAVLYNHGGGGRVPEGPDAVTRFFTANGYVFFMPHRRGHGRSAGLGTDLAGMTRDARAAGRPIGKEFVRLHETEQLDDQLAALEYMAQLPYVDKSRIIIAGCSAGGIQTILSAERGTRARVGISFAGAAVSWKEMPELQQRLRTAARGAKVPLFILQAENDVDTTPGRELGAELARAGKPHQMKIYPPHPVGGHGPFCMDPGVWGADVLAFIAKYSNR